MLEHLVAVPDGEWLFPGERNEEKPVGVSAMSRRLRKAYERAELPRLDRGLWHPWRRKWATERKGMPVKDVAAAGGWKRTFVLQEIYQQPDDDTLLRVVTGGAELRSTG